MCFWKSKGGGHYVNENGFSLCFLDGFDLHQPGFRSKPGPNAMLKLNPELKLLGQIHVWIEQDYEKLKEPDDLPNALLPFEASL